MPLWQVSSSASQHRHSNECLIINIGVDTAENDPCKDLEKVCTILQDLEKVCKILQDLQNVLQNFWQLFLEFSKIVQNFSEFSKNSLEFFGISKKNVWSSSEFSKKKFEHVLEFFATEQSRLPNDGAERPRRHSQQATTSTFLGSKQRQKVPGSQGQVLRSIKNQNSIFFRFCKF